VHLTGGYAPRFQAIFLAQANSVKMALSCPSRQQVTHTVGRTSILWRHTMSSSKPIEPFVLKIDKANHIKNRGTVVTGKIIAGEVRRGDQIVFVSIAEKQPLTLTDHPSVNFKQVEVARNGQVAQILLPNLPPIDVRLGMTLQSPSAAANSLDLFITQATAFVNTAPASEKVERYKERSALYRAAEMEREAIQDLLYATYAAEAYLRKSNFKPGQGTSLAAELIGFGGSSFNAAWDIFAKLDAAKVIRADRHYLLQSGKIRAVGFCRECQAAIELDHELRCPASALHPSPVEVVYVLPDQIGMARDTILNKHIP